MQRFQLTTDDVTALSRMVVIGVGDAIYDADAGELIVLQAGLAADISVLTADPDWRSGVLQLVRQELRVAVDLAAENERLRHITGGAGQAMTYQRKAEEARACLSVIDPENANYPMLSAEVGITAATLIGVAEVVNAAHEAWLVVGAQIEAARLGAKAAIDAAETVEAAQAAASIIWPPVMGESE